MSHDPFDDLPEQMREAIKEMMKKIQEIDPADLENMFEQVLGKDFMEKMKDMQSSGGGFGFPMDPNMMKNFESMMNNKNRDESSSQTTPKEIEVEEPYYEISPVVENEGEIVVDLPGITDVRQIKWDRTDFGLELWAESEDSKYAIDIPLSRKFKLKDVFAEVKNSVFILPYRSVE